MVPGSRVRVPFFHLVELGSSHCVEAVAGDFVLGTAKTAQPAIDCVLGHGALCRTKLRKQESAWPCVSLNLRDDCQRLLAKREGGAAEQLGRKRHRQMPFSFRLWNESSGFVGERLIAFA